MKEREKTLFEDVPVLEAIFKLAVPTVVGQIILVLYNMADTFFIGLTGSDAMITAATVCMPAFMFLQAISNLFGVGGASVISRALGARALQRAKDTASFAFWGCAALTALYSLGAWLFAGPFVDLLGGSNPLVHDYAVEYLTCTVVIGGLATSLNALLAHLVRSEGRSLQASIGVALGGVMNIALDPLFMFVLLPRGYETLGAAIATALSNAIALGYFLVVVLREGKRSILRLSPRRLGKSIRGRIPADVLTTGLPACMMTLCENVSYAVLDALMAVSGTALQAGLGVAKKVNMLAHSIVRGMSQGVLPLIGYNYASGDHKRMKASITLSMALYRHGGPVHDRLAGVQPPADRPVHPRRQRVRDLRRGLPADPLLGRALLRLRLCADLLLSGGGQGNALLPAGHPPQGSAGHSADVPAQPASAHLRRRLGHPHHRRDLLLHLHRDVRRLSAGAGGSAGRQARHGGACASALDEAGAFLKFMV